MRSRTGRRRSPSDQARRAARSASRRHRVPRRQGPRLASVPGGRGVQLLGRPAVAAASSTTSAIRGRASPLGRCCDVCDPDIRLPAPETLQCSDPPLPRSGAESPPRSSRSRTPALLDALKAWRLRAAAGKPAYTVAHNRTLEAIAASRPARLDALGRIHGIGPAFLDQHGATSSRSSRIMPPQPTRGHAELRH